MLGLDETPHFVPGPLLASGSTAEVHLAMYGTTGQVYVLKKARPGFEACLEREANILKRLGAWERTGGIAHLVCILHNDGTLVLDYAEGPTLAEVVNSYCRPVPEAFALSIARQLLQTLAEIHSQGITHGDIKPDNIVVSNGQPTLLDFGAARFIGEEEEESTEKGEKLCGCPLFLPPETLYGDANPSTPAGDIWACGIVLCFLLAGKAPCSVTEVLEGAYKGHRSIRHLLGFLSSTSRSTRRLIRAMLNPNPTYRPSAKALLKYSALHSKIENRGAPLEVQQR